MPGLEERRTEELSAAEVWKSQMDAGINVTGRTFRYMRRARTRSERMGVHELSYLIAEEVTGYARKMGESH